MITSPRLTLRRMRNSDLAALVAYRSLPEVMQWQLWDSYDAIKGQAMIDELQTAEPFVANTYFQFAVGLRSNDSLIGDVYFKMDEAGTQAELGYTFSPEHQRQGYATEAVRGLLDHAFRVKGMHRVYAITDPRHERSWKLMRRVGMRMEAHHVENLWFKGAWADDVIYAVLAREWVSPLW